MPCDSGMGGGYDYHTQRELDKVTRLLCALLTQLEKDTGKSLVIEDAELSSWWQRHKILDEARQQRIETEKRRQILRNKARQKLTVEELDALLNK